MAGKSSSVTVAKQRIEGDIESYRKIVARVVKSHLRHALENVDDQRLCYGALYQVSWALLNLAGMPAAPEKILQVVVDNTTTVLAAAGLVGKVDVK